MTVPLQAKSTRAVIFIKFAWFGTFRLLLFDHITPPLTDYTATSRGGVFSARGGVFSEWRCNLSKTAPNRSHGCSSTEESMGFVHDFVEKCFEIRQLEHAFSKICNGYKPPTSMTPKWSKNDGTVAGQKYTSCHFHQIYSFWVLFGQNSVPKSECSEIPEKTFRGGVKSVNTPPPNHWWRCILHRHQSESCRRLSETKT